MTDGHRLVGSCIGVGEGTVGRHCQHVALDDAAVHNLVIDQRCSCRAVIDLVLGHDATDDNILLANGDRKVQRLRIGMVGVTLYLIIYCIRAGCNTCGNGCLISRAVKAVHQRTADRLACSNKMLG